jgi:iron complex transport system ATP-binding protein
MCKRSELLVSTTNKTNHPLLSVSNLSWYAGNTQILSDISFQVPVGSFTGMLGPNGAGKSSLLRCLYRYISPANGQIKFNNQDIRSLSNQEFARNVAVVLQHTPQQFNLSVFDVVALGLIPVGLSDKTQVDFETLSGGEKQRVMIARAIVQRPQLLLMDEPTSHLDVKYQIQIMELAKSLGITIIASFHDINLASALCDQLLVLKKGSLQAVGQPKEVITEVMLSNVFDVCTKVSQHPQHHAPHVTYFYGYNSSDRAANQGDDK